MIKKLPSKALRDIQRRNKIRLEMGMSLIEIKIRKCLACGIKFESTGMRTCGCNLKN